jgi:GTPase SAR1 family protein
VFFGFGSFFFSFSRNVTVIIVGLDNSGKSTLVEAFQKCEELRALDTDVVLPGFNEIIIPS